MTTTQPQKQTDTPKQTQTLYFFGWITETNNDTSNPLSISISGGESFGLNENVACCSRTCHKTRTRQPSTQTGIIEFLRAAILNNDGNLLKNTQLTQIYPLTHTVDGVQQCLYPPGFYNRKATNGFNSVYMFEEDNFDDVTSIVIHENIHKSCWHACNFLYPSPGLNYGDEMQRFANKMIPSHDDEQNPFFEGYDFVRKKIVPLSHEISGELSNQGYWDLIISINKTFNTIYDDDAKTSIEEGYYPVAKARWVSTS